MSAASSSHSRVPPDLGRPGADLGPEELWDLHGASLFAMACALLGEESAATSALTLGMMDLYRHPEHMPRHPADEALRDAGRCVYVRCSQVPADDTTGWSAAGPPVIARLRDLALLQRTTLALCIFGGHTYREAAAVLHIPAGAAARLLISGLQDLVPLIPLADQAPPGTPVPLTQTWEREASDVERAYALYEQATEILMAEHGLAENYAMERLCRNASAAGSTVVEAATLVIAEAGASTGGPPRLQSVD